MSTQSSVLGPCPTWTVCISYLLPKLSSSSDRSPLALKYTWKAFTLKKFGLRVFFGRGACMAHMHSKHSGKWMFPYVGLSCFSRAQLFATVRTIAHQAPLSMAFSRQEYWSGMPFSSPGDLPDPGIEPESFTFPALAGKFFTTSATWMPPSVQFSSVAQSCPALCDPMDCTTPVLPVHCQLPEFTQTHVH